MSIQCFAGAKKDLSSTNREACLFELKMNDSFPDTAKLTNDHHCKQYNFDSATENPYCYAAIVIDYYSKTIIVVLDLIQTYIYWERQYSSIFNDHKLKTMKSVYTINVDVIKSPVFISTAATHIVCMTHENCAIEQIKKALVSELPKTDKRREIFQQITAVFNQPTSTTKPSSLICSDAQDKAVECIDDQTHCWIHTDRPFEKYTPCIFVMTGINTRFLYVLSWNGEKDLHTAGVEENSTLMGVCQIDNCNDRKTIEKIKGLLLTFLDPFFHQTNSNTDGKNNLQPKSSNNAQSNQSPTYDFFMIIISISIFNISSIYFIC